MKQVDNSTKWKRKLPQIVAKVSEQGNVLDKLIRPGDVALQGGIRDETDQRLQSETGLLNTKHLLTNKIKYRYKTVIPLEKPQYHLLKRILNTVFRNFDTVNSYCRITTNLNEPKLPQPKKVRK